MAVTPVSFRRGRGGLAFVPDGGQGPVVESSANKAQETLFGRIAVELGAVTPEQLVEATLLQGREGWRRKLGEVFLDLGWIDSNQLLEILRAQRAWKETGGADEGVARAPVPVRSPWDSRLEPLLRDLVARGASDLHLHSHAAAMMRHDGELVPIPAGPRLEDADVRQLLDPLLSPAEKAELVATGQVDFAVDVPGLARFRGSAYRQSRGTDAVLRAIPLEPPTLDSLGLPTELARLIQHHQGLVLVTGPSGCGKTSTLAALVRLINEERRDHILCAEQPIEFRHASVRSLVNQREIGRHSAGYEQMLRAALREDPDVIALGDLRDKESIGLALTAAETGHLVIATMHTGSAVRTIHRLIGAFPPAEQEQVRVMLSESLRAIVSQRLVRRASGQGRAVAMERLFVTRAVSSLIRENKTHQIESVLQLGAAEGMCSLDASLDALVRRRVVAAAEADRHRLQGSLSGSPGEVSGAAG